MDYSLENLLWLTALLLLVIYWLTRRTTGHLPPSPMKPLPIVGHLLYLDKDMKSCFMKWRKQCGDIFSLHLGSRILVVINGFDLINETFVKRANDFSDRPVMSSDKFKEYHSKGIVFTSGKVWKEQRDVSLTILRRFGLGKNLLAQRVLKEVDYYLDLLDSYGGQPVDIRPMTIKSTANVMCSILTGQRFDYEDPTFERLIVGAEQFMVSNNQAGLFDFMPFLKYLPGFRSSYNRLQETLQNLYHTLQDIIDRCKYKEPEDNFIASYQAEKEARINNGEDTSLDDANFLKCVFDLFLAGTETTATTLCWFILYMLNYPDIQSKVFHEISHYVGTSRPISMQDRPYLVYLRATIQEAQRLANILPHSVARICPKEIQIRNYDIPKDSFIIPNLDSVLFDEKIWGPDVHDFRPERFIDDKGQLKNFEEFIPFGVGRRICLGRAMAKTEFFLYLGSMIQRFQFVPVKPDNPPSMKYICGITFVPEPFKVKVLKREGVKSTEMNGLSDGISVKI